jgi:hypothetical protein
VVVLPEITVLETVAVIPAVAKFPIIASPRRLVEALLRMLIEE